MGVPIVAFFAAINLFFAIMDSSWGISSWVAALNYSIALLCAILAIALAIRQQKN